MFFVLSLSIIEVGNYALVCLLVCVFFTSVQKSCCVFVCANVSCIICTCAEWPTNYLFKSHRETEGLETRSKIEGGANCLFHLGVTRLGVT